MIKIKVKNGMFDQLKYKLFLSKYSCCTIEIGELASN